ncbi:MAG: peptidylprolyl isomerase [Steroidobacteraceae bacterium]
MYRTNALRLVLGAAFVLAVGPLRAAAPPSYADLLAATRPSDWRDTDPRYTLYVELPQGRVVIELAPAFAPGHVRNILELVRRHYFDGLAILRVQDNYVAQWGDADHRHPLPAALPAVEPEFDRPIAAELPFTRLADGDVYAPQVGFTAGLPAARDPASGRTWLAHCYGMVGVGRDDDPASGSGAELYVVIGHSPRHLDRNVALVGRVLSGIELLSGLPRGGAPMGFYEQPSQRILIRQLRLEYKVPAAEREHLQVIRTDTPAFDALVESRRNRHESWFARPAGRIELCNVPIAVRKAPRRYTDLMG